MSIEVHKRETTTNSMQIKPLVLLPQTQLRCWQGTSAGKQTNLHTKTIHVTCGVKSAKRHWNWESYINRDKHEPLSHSEGKKGLFIHAAADKKAASHLLSLTARSSPPLSPQFHSLQTNTGAKIIVHMETEWGEEGGSLAKYMFHNTNPNWGQTVDYHIYQPQF